MHRPRHRPKCAALRTRRRGSAALPSPPWPPSSEPTRQRGRCRRDRANGWFSGPQDLYCGNASFLPGLRSSCSRPAVELRKTAAAFAFSSVTPGTGSQPKPTHRSSCATAVRRPVPVSCPAVTNRWAAWFMMRRAVSGCCGPSVPGMSTHSRRGTDFFGCPMLIGYTSNGSLARRHPWNTRPKNRPARWRQLVSRTHASAPPLT